MANVHGFVYSQNGYPKRPFRYAYSVGFGIAYPRLEGNAKAYRSGMSDEFRFPRFFMWIWVITDQIPRRESAEEHKKEHE